MKIKKMMTVFAVSEDHHHFLLLYAETPAKSRGSIKALPLSRKQIKNQRRKTLCQRLLCKGSSKKSGEGELVTMKFNLNFKLRGLLPSLVACDICHTSSQRKAIVSRHSSVKPDNRHYQS